MEEAMSVASLLIVQLQQTQRHLSLTISQTVGAGWNGALVAEGSCRTSEVSVTCQCVILSPSLLFFSHWTFERRRAVALADSDR